MRRIPPRDPFMPRQQRQEHPGRWPKVASILLTIAIAVILIVSFDPS